MCTWLGMNLFLVLITFTLTHAQAHPNASSPISSCHHLDLLTLLFLGLSVRYMHARSQH